MTMKFTLVKCIKSSNKAFEVGGIYHLNFDSHDITVYSSDKKLGLGVDANLIHESSIGSYQFDEVDYKDITAKYLLDNSKSLRGLQIKLDDIPGEVFTFESACKSDVILGGLKYLVHVKFTDGTCCRSNIHTKYEVANRDGE